MRLVLESRCQSRRLRQILSQYHYRHRHRQCLLYHLFELEELCCRYDGQDGIVDVYSTNPNLKDIYNYGDLRYIESQEDYNNWYRYEQLKRLIPQIKKELDEWDNRDNVPFNQRPFFEPTYTRVDLAEYELKLGVYDMSFVPPKPYNNL